MNYYRIQYCRGLNPSGAFYTVRSTEEYKPGDKVRLYGGKMAVIVGEGDLDYVRKVGDEGLIPIISKEGDYGQ